MFAGEYDVWLMNARLSEFGYGSVRIAAVNVEAGAVSEVDGTGPYNRSPAASHETDAFARTGQYQTIKWAELQTKKATPEKPRELPSNAALCEAMQDHQVGVTGLEPVTSAM